jgi:hypothetical protein
MGWNIKPVHSSDLLLSQDIDIENQYYLEVNRRLGFCRVETGIGLLE